MKVRRIHAPDMRQAIRQVREEQGPDAVILSSKNVEGGVEVLAAVDFDEAWVEQVSARPVHVTAAPRPAASRNRARWEPPEPAPSRPVQAPASVPAQPMAVQPEPPQAAPAQPAPLRAVRSDVAEPVVSSAALPPRPGLDALFGDDDATSMVDALESDLERVRSFPSRGNAGQDSGLDELRREVQSMRGLLQAELAALAGDDYARRHPLRAQLSRRLEKLGLDQALARRIADESRHADSSQDAWREGLSVLARRIPISERDLMLRGGVIALIGPTGVGKTSTALKLASAFVARHGRQSVALIAADSDRLGAERELLAIGQKLGIYTLVASGAEELREALATVSDRRLVLVDTAGMGYRDPRLTEQARLLAGLPEVEPWLVLAANAQRCTLEATIRCFSALGPRGCVLTKIDETTSLGEALGAAMACGMPLNFATDGQGIEEAHLHAARGDRLVTRMVALAREHAPDRSGPAAAPAPRSRQEALHA
jgi:flagellar biosynthesis protein FlhF